MKAFPSSSFVAFAVAAAASLILPVTATVQVGQATLLDPTVSSDTCGIPITEADLYAAVADSPGGDSRCKDTIIAQCVNRLESGIWNNTIVMISTRSTPLGNSIWTFGSLDCAPHLNILLLSRLWCLDATPSASFSNSGLMRNLLEEEERDRCVQAGSIRRLSLHLYSPGRAGVSNLALRRLPSVHVKRDMSRGNRGDTGGRDSSEVRRRRCAPSTYIRRTQRTRDELAPREQDARKQESDKARKAATDREQPARE
ncbi:hypothetical protein FB451DRAFT_1532351 [Mycena latifolia]|nr:hypothetical protein FB451DRAFT_1532351 [Mycena latifolia]